MWPASNIYTARRTNNTKHVPRGISNKIHPECNWQLTPINEFVSVNNNNILNRERRKQVDVYKHGQCDDAWSRVFLCRTPNGRWWVIVCVEQWKKKCLKDSVKRCSEGVSDEWEPGACRIALLVLLHYILALSILGITFTQVSYSQDYQKCLLNM